MQSEFDETERGFIGALVGDGRALLALVALSLMLSGGFAIFQSATGHFLPHDEEYLGMTKEQICGVQQCRIVHFMFHDRVSFGGAIAAIGGLYLWILRFPLGRGESWAWWLFAVSGAAGFGSFLAYLGYGYLDSWHGIATLFLLGPYLWGMARTRRSLGVTGGPVALFRSGARLGWGEKAGIGRALLLFVGLGMMTAGVVVTVVGMTAVFVPQDLKFMGMTANELNTINPRLIPLIAHDRAGFGGGLATCGLIWFFCVWCAPMSRSLWEALALVGGIGFICAIGVHPVIGYTDFVHLVPAYTGAGIWLVGLWLSYSGTGSGIRSSGGRTPTLA